MQPNGISLHPSISHNICLRAHIYPQYFLCPQVFAPFLAFVSLLVLSLYPFCLSSSSTRLSRLPSGIPFVLWFLALGKIPGSARSEFRQSGFVSANQCHRRRAPTLLLLLPTHCPHNMSGHWMSTEGPAGLKASTHLAEKLWEVMTGCLI